MAKYGIDSVFSDSETGAEIAVTHLIETGCKKITHISGPTFITIAQDRIRGYKSIMSRHGLEVDDERMISHGDYSHKSGYLAMQELLHKTPDLDGVFVANDQMSVGAMKALFEAGKRIPLDVKVIGYDDVFIAGVLEPSLSTVKDAPDDWILTDW